MEYSMTTSISLPLSLGQQLNRLAKKMRCGNDWIIVEALKEYARKTSSISLFSRRSTSPVDIGKPT